MPSQKSRFKSDKNTTEACQGKKRKKEKTLEASRVKINNLYHEVKIVLGVLSNVSSQADLLVVHLVDESAKIQDLGYFEKEEIEKVSELLGFRVVLNDCILDVAGRIRKALVH